MGKGSGSCERQPLCLGDALPVNTAAGPGSSPEVLLSSDMESTTSVALQKAPLTLESAKGNPFYANTPLGGARIEPHPTLPGWVFSHPSPQLQVVISQYIVTTSALKGQKHPDNLTAFSSIRHVREFLQSVAGETKLRQIGAMRIEGCEPYRLTLLPDQKGWKVTGNAGPGLHSTPEHLRGIFKVYPTRKTALEAVNTWWNEHH